VTLPQQGSAEDSLSVLDRLAAFGLAVLSPFPALACTCTSCSPLPSRRDTSIVLEIILAVLALGASAALSGMGLGGTADGGRSVGHLCDGVSQEVELLIALHHGFEMLGGDTLDAACAGNVSGPKGDADHEEFQGFGCATESASWGDARGEARED